MDGDKITQGIYEKMLDGAKEYLRIQGASGNWDYDPYMHGMYNGMVAMLSVFNNIPPEYREAPTEWGCNNPDVKEPVKVSELNA